MKNLIDKLIFTITLKRVLLLSCCIGIYSIMPLMFFKYLSQTIDRSLTNIEEVFSIVIGLMLIFRANRSYERWWEARSLWGNLIGLSRNLSIKIKSILDLELLELNKASNFIISFAYTLKDQLHNINDHSCKAALRDPDVTTIQLVHDFYMLIKNWRKQNLITIQELWLIDQELRNFLLIAGACDKIKNTLLSKSFRVFSRQLIFLFILLLPWIFVSSLGYFIILFSIISSYIVIAIEGIAYNLEQPFGDTEDHLNMEKMARTIEVSTRKILN